jgi:hypothetical protein
MPFGRSRKIGETEIKYDTSTQKKHRYHNKYRHFIDTSEEIGLEVNAEKTQYMFLSHFQSAGKNHKNCKQII